jgi:hypothetical protein
MDDPDSQDALEEMSRTLGSGIGTHVFFDPRPTVTLGPSAGTAGSAASARRAKRDVILRRHYRFEPIYCEEWSDIPRILEDLRTYPGPVMRSIIDDCEHVQLSKRDAAHAKLAQLNNNGAALAVREIRLRLSDETDNWKCSEWCYALGTIRPLRPEIRAILKNRVEKKAGVREVALAVMMLADYAKQEDIPWLEAQAAAWKAVPHPDAKGARDPQDRIPTYFEYLIKKTTAKYSTWNRDTV